MNHCNMDPFGWFLVSILLKSAVVSGQMFVINNGVISGTKSLKHFFGQF